MEPTLVIITGPTASGKTDLSIQVAKALNTEIVSFDSRQFYKEMSIGTAKPSIEQLKEVKHHFIGHISIKDKFNAGQFETEAIEMLNNLFKQYPYVVFTGGSGLYMDAVLHGLDDLPKVDEIIRDQLNEVYRMEGIEALQKKLADLDNEYYQEVDLNNPHRLIRALELILSTGLPYSQLRRGQQKQRNFKSLLVGIDTEREQLYHQINARVDKMMEEGLLEEVKSLMPFRPSNALETVGYKELFDYLEGRMDLEETVNLIKQNTRRFAKRQITWFKKYKEINWLKQEDAEKIILQLLQK